MDYSKIKAFAFDVDGVMTDGGVYVEPNGDFIRKFDAKDGFAVRMASMNGYVLGVITGGASQTIKTRVKASGVPEKNVYLSSRDKVVDFLDFCRSNGLQPEEVCYVGDDIPDIPVLTMCGLPACPSDAVLDVKRCCAFVAEHNGGDRAIREIVETVMRCQGKWNFDALTYKAKF